MNLNIINPVTNTLPNGLSIQQISDAVQTSGYPLQTIVYEKLSNKFNIQEEWSYLDSDSNEERAIDLLSQLRLFDYKEPQSRIRPSLNLIIECKQSTMPYVFFLTKDKPRTPKFPLFAGLASNTISVTSDDDPSTYNFSVLQALGLSEHPFLRDTPIFANTFSKGARKGQKVELSGSQSYQGLVLPLLKAIAYFEECERPPSTAHYFDCHLTIAVALIDGPMIGVNNTDTENEIQMIPWVRVPRHQTTNKDDKYHMSNISAIDVVHKDFLDEYINNHLIPFANDFSQRALNHADELADGKGFISGIGKDSLINIENRLVPHKIKHIPKRINSIFSKIIAIYKK